MATVSTLVVMGSLFQERYFVNHDSRSFGNLIQNKPFVSIMIKHWNNLAVGQDHAFVVEEPEMDCHLTTMNEGTTS